LSRPLHGSFDEHFAIPTVSAVRNSVDFPHNLLTGKYLHADVFYFPDSTFIEAGHCVADEHRAKVPFGGLVQACTRAIGIIAAREHQGSGPELSEVLFQFGMVEGPEARFVYDPLVRAYRLGLSTQKDLRVQ
jgi:hypothetical protein